MEILQSDDELSSLSASKSLPFPPIRLQEVWKRKVIYHHFRDEVRSLGTLSQSIVERFQEWLVGQMGVSQNGPSLAWEGFF